MENYLQPCISGRTLDKDGAGSRSQRNPAPDRTTCHDHREGSADADTVAPLAAIVIVPRIPGDRMTADRTPEDILTAGMIDWFHDIVSTRTLRTIAVDLIEQLENNGVAVFAVDRVT